MSLHKLSVLQYGRNSGELALRRATLLALVAVPPCYFKDRAYACDVLLSGGHLPNMLSSCWIAASRYGC